MFVLVVHEGDLFVVSCHVLGMQKFPGNRIYELFYFFFVIFWASLSSEIVLVGLNGGGPGL